MSPSLEPACIRLEAAIRAQNSALSSSDAALALLGLHASLTQALQQWQETLIAPAPDQAELQPVAAAPAFPELLQAGGPLSARLTVEQATTLSALHALRQRLITGDATVTAAELYQHAHQAAQTAADLWPNLSERPAPQVEWPPAAAIQEPLPAGVEQAQRELQRQRQRTVELEQNSQRLSRALTAANNEMDRLRALLAGANKPENTTPEWQQGLQFLFIGLLFIGIGLGAYFLARLALNLPWPWLFTSFLIVLGLPVGLYAGAIYIVRGSRKLSLDRLLGYAAILLLLAFVVATLADQTPGSLSVRAGAVMTRWVGGALRSPLTLIQAGLQAPAPFIAALRGRSPTVTLSEATAVANAASGEPTPTAAPTLTPVPATVAPEPTATAFITPTATLTATVSITIGIGSQVRVVNTQFLNARRDAGLRFQLATRFPADVILTVLRGPITADNYTWWEVKGEAGQGWCADQWLQPAP